MSLPTGVENLAVPSFTPDFAGLDEAGIRHDVRQAKAHGFTSTMCVCDAGLAPEEMRRLVEVVVDEAGSELHVGVALPQDSFARAREVLAQAEGAGCSHALVGFPQAFRPRTSDDVVAALGALADATELALVLPVAETSELRHLHPSGVPLDAYDELAGHPNVAGVQIAIPDPMATYAVGDRLADRLDVAIATPLLLGALALLHARYGVRRLGAAVWEAWQSPAGPHVVELLDHVVAGREREALDVHWRLGPARGIAMGAGLLQTTATMPNWPLNKYLSWSVGGNGGPTRDPAMRITHHHFEARKLMLRTLGIDPPASDAGFFAGRTPA